MGISKIVITGGPCAGKSTALSRIQSEFTALGYRVLFIGETATELIGGGVAPWTCKTNGEYQKLQLRLQIEKEKIFEITDTQICGKKDVWPFGILNFDTILSCTFLIL